MILNKIDKYYLKLSKTKSNGKYAWNLHFLPKDNKVQTLYFL